MKLLPRQPVNNDDTIGRGMDLALVTLVFLGMGWALDRWLGTEPAFMIGLVVFALVGQFVKLWYDYDAKMRAHEAARAELRRSRTTGGAAPAATGHAADPTPGAPR